MTGSRRPIVHSLTRFLESPASVRLAMRVIVIATVTTTILGGVVMWALDRKDFQSFGDAMWWSLQTVTTVGYGDVTPTNLVGRLIGAVVLVYAVAFLAILTAAITTSFVARAQRERHAAPDPQFAAVLDGLQTIAARLARLEERLGVAEIDDGPA